MKTVVQTILKSVIVTLTLTAATPAMADNLSLLTREEQDIYNTGRLSGGQIAGGSALGLVAGFGLGHAMIGKYSDYGWVFTLIDGVATASAVGFFVASQTADREPGVWAGFGEYLIGLGSLGLLGVSHIAQAVSIPVSGSNHNDAYDAIQKKVTAQPTPVSFYMSPIVKNDGAGMSLGLKF